MTPRALSGGNLFHSTRNDVAPFGITLTEGATIGTVTTIVLGLYIHIDLPIKGDVWFMLCILRVMLFRLSVELQ